MLKKNLMTYLVVFSVLLFGMSTVYAQADTETPTPAPIVDAPELENSGELPLTVNDYEFVKTTVLSYLTRQDFQTAVLSVMVSALIFVIVFYGRKLYKANPKEAEIIFEIGDIVVKVIPSQIDNNFFEFVKRLIRDKDESTPESIRRELFDAKTGKTK